MLPPAAYVTVAQRTELLTIVRLTDGFHRSITLLRRLEKIYQPRKPAVVVKRFGEIISNPGFIRYMAPDTSGWEMLVD